MKTVNDIVADQIAMLEDLRAGKIAAKDATEINNTVGKVIAAIKTQLVYASLRQEKPSIPFLARSTELKKLGE